jgi:hypothetical protein
MIENLNYSATRLLQVFPKYFNADLAKQYEFQPERIANKVYANRMGNEDEASGAELTYAVFDTKEFLYRLNMYDKLIRDILDYPHEVVLQSKELSTQTLKKA